MYVVVNTCASYILYVTCSLIFALSLRNDGVRNFEKIMMEVYLRLMKLCCFIRCRNCWMTLLSTSEYLDTIASVQPQELMFSSLFQKYLLNLALNCEDGLERVRKDLKNGMIESLYLYVNKLCVFLRFHLNISRICTGWIDFV